MKYLFRCIGLMFLLSPMAYCLSQVCFNLYLRGALLVCFSIGFSFVKFKFEDKGEKK